MDTSDLEKTVAIDWSQETSVEDSGEQEGMVSESGAEGHAELPEFGIEPEPEPAEEPKAAEEPKPAAQSAIDEGGIDLGDFDFDKIEEEKNEESVQSASDDEFSSTIRTTQVNLTVPSAADEEAMFDLSSENAESDVLDLSEEEKSSMPVSEPEEDAPSLATGAENESGMLLDLDEDMDETQKLDDLLSEFADEDEKDGDKKD
jgi:hypothetical protein